MSFSDEPRTHSGEPSRCNSIRYVQGYGTDNHNCGNCGNCGNCLACREASAAAFQLAALHDNYLMQNGMNFSPSASANPHYNFGPTSSTSFPGPPVGPAAVVPGSGPPAFFEANNNAASPGNPNVNPSVSGSAVCIGPGTLPNGVPVLWWADDYNYWWTSRPGDPPVDYTSAASTSPGDADSPSQRTVTTPASSTVATPSSAQANQCDHCARPFKLAKDLKRHLRTVHFRDGDMVWRCICGRMQSRKDNHKTHLETCKWAPVAHAYYVCACQKPCVQKDDYMDHFNGCTFGLAARGRPRTS